MAVQLQPKPNMSPIEYLTNERQSATKSEYWRGKSTPWLAPAPAIH